jgi:hypothetical protein
VCEGRKAVEKIVERRINNGAGAQILAPKSPGLSPGLRASESEAEPSSQGFCGLGLGSAGLLRARLGLSPGLSPSPEDTKIFMGHEHPMVRLAQNNRES